MTGVGPIRHNMRNHPSNSTEIGLKRRFAASKRQPVFAQAHDSPQSGPDEIRQPSLLWLIPGLARAHFGSGGAAGPVRRWRRDSAWRRRRLSLSRSASGAGLRGESWNWSALRRRLRETNNGFRNLFENAAAQASTSPRRRADSVRSIRRLRACSVLRMRRNPLAPCRLPPSARTSTSRILSRREEFVERARNGADFVERIRI